MGLDEELGPALHEVHATWPTGVTLEFLLDEVDDTCSTWLYRRDTRVQRPLTAVFRTRDRTPYFSPEVVLLYKSKGTRENDAADFARCPASPRFQRQAVARRRDRARRRLASVARGAPRRTGRLTAE